MNTDNLVFFNSKGRRIPLQYTHTVTFAVTGICYQYDKMYGWRDDASGWFTVDRHNRIVSSDIDCAGATYGLTTEQLSKLENPYEQLSKTLVNEICVTVTDGSVQHSFTYTNKTKGTDEIATYFDISLGRRSENYATGDSSLSVFYVKSVTPKDPLELVSKLAENGYSLNLYPSTQFLGVVNMDKVSADLCSTETLFILENDSSYTRPRSLTQNIRVEFSSDSSTSVIKQAAEWWNSDAACGSDTSLAYTDLDYSKAYFSKYKVFDLLSENIITRDSSGLIDDVSYSTDPNEPLALSLSFTHDSEGCYQDIATIYSVDGVQSAGSIEYNRIGYLAVRNECIGEDERYRTLFTNFGIPDPKTYPTLFKDASIAEENTDWELVNRKSKELFLTYDQIFPYAGSYKALVNAVRFLGYDDVYFKEWYQYFDGKSENRLSYKSVDISTGSVLSSKLERVGVSFDDFMKWKKLNQLSMMYRINEESDEFDTTAYYTDASLAAEKYTPSPYVKLDGVKSTANNAIPSVTQNYSYYNSEVLAKLYYLKKWLETYIVNINCQIIDVTGEGVYFTRFKQAATTVGYTKFDDIRSLSVSPVIDDARSSLKMTDSSASLFATLKEFDRQLTIDNLSGKSINDCVMSFCDKNGNKVSVDGSVDFCFGTSIDNGADYSSVGYEIRCDASCGAVQATSSVTDNKNPLIVADNRLTLWNSQDFDTVLDNAPVICLEAATLRNTYGRWEDSSAFEIGSFFDSSTSSYRYGISNGTYSRTYGGYITLLPKFVTDSSGNATCISRLSYTSCNRYGTPLLIARNYDTFDGVVRDSCIYARKLVRNAVLEDASAAHALPVGSAGYISESEMNKIFSDTEKSYIEDVSDISSAYATGTAFNEYVLDIRNGYFTAADDTATEYKVTFDRSYSTENNLDSQNIYITYTDRTGMKPVVSCDTIKTAEARGVVRSRVSHLLLSADSSLRSKLSVLAEDTSFDGSTGYSDYDDLCAEYKTERTFIQSMLTEDSSKAVALVSLLDGESYLSESVRAQLLSQLKDASTRLETENKFMTDSSANMQSDLSNLYRHYNAEYAFDASNIASDGDVSLRGCIEDNATRQTSHTFDVRHTGEWTLTAKVTDGFGCPAAAQAERATTVYKKSPDVAVLSLDTSTDIHPSDVSMVFDSEPHFPQKVRYITTSVPDDCSIIYENRSYCAETPDNGDILRFTNCTERISDAAFDASGNLSVGLFAENPLCQNPYYTGSSVYIYFTDRRTGDLVRSANSIAGPFTTESFSKSDGLPGHTGRLTLSFNRTGTKFTPADASLLADISRSGQTEGYVSTVPSIDVSAGGVVNDSSTRTSVITSYDISHNGQTAFSAGDKVKILFRTLTYGGLDTAGNAITSSSYISGTAYRIISSEYDYATFSQKYTLDGLVNTGLLTPQFYRNGVYNSWAENREPGIPYAVTAQLVPAHTVYCSYETTTLSAAEDGSVGYLNILSDSFGSCAVDRSFSFFKDDFNINDAYHDWESATVEDASMYAVSYNPVTVYTGDTFGLISTPNDGNATYSSKWSVTDNSDNLLYILTNDNICAVPKYSGEYKFALEAVDIYGNRTYNTNQGFVKIT